MRRWYGSSICSATRLSLLLVLLVASTTSVRGQSYTWTGNAAPDNQWLTAGNWDAAGVPVSGSDVALDFTGSAASSYNNNPDGFQLNTVTFDVSSTVFNLSGGSLDFVNSSSAVAPVLTQDSAVAINIANNLTLSNDLSLQGAGTGNITLTGVISGSGGLITSGSFTSVVANSNNSYTGGTTVAGGTLQLGADNAITTGTDLIVTGTTAAATFDLAGHQQTIGNLTFGDGTANSINNLQVIDSSSGSAGVLTLNGNVILQYGQDSMGNPVTPTAYINSALSLAGGQHTIDNPSLGISTSNYDLVIAGQISGAGGMDLGPQGILNVALTHANNTYSGATNLINGNLYLGATNGLPASTAVTVDIGGILYLYIDPNTLPQTGLVAGNYSQSIGSLADGPNGGGIVYLGGATLTVGSDNTNTTFSGQISDNDGAGTPGTTGGSLVKVGTGTLTLSGNLNNYTGSTTINAGTLQLGVDNALPTAPATDLNLTGGTFDTNTYNQTVNHVTNAGGTVYINNSTLTVNAAFSQTSGLSRIDGTLANATVLQLSGGDLVGTGNTTSGVNNTGGRIHPGDSASGSLTGTLQIGGDYSQTMPGKLQIDLGGTVNGSSYDLLQVLGAANPGGELDVKLVNSFIPTQGETFDFLTYGSRIGDFDSVISLDPGYAYSVSYSTDGTTPGIGTLTVITVAGVPESSTLLLAALMLGMGGLLLRRRNRVGSTLITWDW